MATGRTVQKHVRFYADGYDFSGYSRSVGPLDVTFDESPDAAFTDDGKNVLPGHCNINIGSLNGFFDNTATSGLHVVTNAAGVKRVVMIPVGIRAAPAQGDPVFCGEFEQQGYYPEIGENYLVVNIPFGGTSNRAATLRYTIPWGRMLHAKAARTAANAATGGVDNAAASALGGYFVYQVFAGDGTATLSVDDSADDSTYDALSGATSGSIDCSTPTAGIIPLGLTADVRRYLRWQLALGTASTVTFATAFVRR
jgi:hypothetical protein